MRKELYELFTEFKACTNPVTQWSLRCIINERLYELSTEENIIATRDITGR